jgi:DNA-binding transcriptional ArsR family regulator
MDPYTHAELSAKKRGGKPEDYFPVHSFIDSTKELCSDNRHRILHTLWGIRRVILPIFGPTLINSDGNSVNIKELCEADHILPDYKNRFIPTLSDFTEAFEELSETEKAQIDHFHASYMNDPEIRELLISPLSVTGQLKALRITHNDWFLHQILPHITGKTFSLKENGSITLFEKMDFRMWMDNGSALPPSAQKIAAIL